MNECTYCEFVLLAAVLEIILKCIWSAVLQATGYLCLHCWLQRSCAACAGVSAAVYYMPGNANAWLLCYYCYVPQVIHRSLPLRLKQSQWTYEQPLILRYPKEMKGYWKKIYSVRSLHAMPVGWRRLEMFNIIAYKNQI